MFQILKLPQVNLVYCYSLNEQGEIISKTNSLNKITNSPLGSVLVKWAIDSESFPSDFFRKS